MIHFAVSDAGIGMSPEFLQSIWNPFEQADSSIARRFGGTGLGLAITKSLVDMMNGTISVESQVGVGSQFRVDIPLGRMEQPIRETLRDVSEVRVLVADDDPSTCDYLKLLFRNYRVDCTAVTSGQEAVDAVRRGIRENARYSVCLIDWSMPEMSGAETIRRIRETADAALPLIVISAYDLADIEPQASALGVDRFIGKPLFQSTVFDLLVGITGPHYSPEKATLAARDFGGARILLAEDNRMNMEIAQAILSSWNLKVDEAWNGSEAVKRFADSPEGAYRLILMDVHMPEMDGYEATRTIRDLPRGDAATVPILAMTADVFAEDVAEAMAAGMNAHIGKPIDPAALGERLAEFLERRN